jgi:hypothetical protein
MRIQSLLSTSAILLLLATGCGDGDVYNNSTESGTSAVTSNEILEAIDSKQVTGVFFGSAVEGVSYMGLTTGLGGKTDSKGEFICESGEDVEFNLGTLHLGTANCQKNITAYDLYLEEYQSVALAMFLMALDEDGDIENGIKIPLSLREQSTESGSLTYDINILDLVLDTANRIIADAPANSFFNGGVIPTIENARLHLEASLVQMGAYSGAIQSIVIDNSGGSCFDNRFISASVNGTNVTLIGFGELSNSESSLSFKRSYDNAAGTSSFDDTIVFPKGSLYDEIRVSNSLVSMGMSAFYEAGKIESDGSFTVRCSGSFALTKDEEIPQIIELRKIARRTFSNSGSMFNIVNAIDLGTDVYNQTSDFHQNESVEFYAYVMAQETFEQYKDNCWDVKDRFQYEWNKTTNLIIRKKALSPLVPDSLVDLANARADDIDRVNEILPVSDDFNPF